MLGYIVCDRFPSPYGVSFILMYMFIDWFEEDRERFRLLTEYHSFL